MYLVRPDAYAGFRSQPTDFEALENISKVFCRSDGENVSIGTSINADLLEPPQPSR
jgi:hypothetical protein